MAYKIIKEDEPLPVSALVTVLYAPPGAGKTSLSFTSKNPFLFDFDGGLKRAVKRKDAVQFESWNDVISFIDSEDFDETAYDTFVFDTADTMLNDFIAHEVAKEKGNKKASGALTQSGYGAMKIVFDAFFNRYKGRKDIIFICHEAEDKRDDKSIVRPKITGGAYQIIIQKADLIGYMEVNTGSDGEKVITLDFDPNETRYAKNFAEFPHLTVPNYNTPEYDGFMEKLLNEAKQKMLTMSEAQKEAEELVKELTARIGEVKTLEECSLMEREISGLSKIYKIQLSNDLDNKMLALWEERLTGTKNMKELRLLDKDLEPLKPRYKEKLNQTYLIVYARHWHAMKTEKGNTPEDFDFLAQSVKEVHATKDLASGFDAKGLAMKLSAELIEAAQEKDIDFNKVTKKFEKGENYGKPKPEPEKKTEDKKADTKKDPKKEDKKVDEKKSEKKDEKKEPDPTPEEKKPESEPETQKKDDEKEPSGPTEEDEMQLKEDRYTKLIKDATKLDELEGFDEAIAELEHPYKARVMKIYTRKLENLTAKSKTNA